MHPILKQHGWLAKEAFLAPFRYFQNNFLDTIRVLRYCFFRTARPSAHKLSHLPHLIVISRFKENIDWLQKLNTPVILYNKGRQLKNQNKLWVEPLTNIGRESHTFLHFIIANYENLPERISFLQADPFEHYPQILESLDKVEQFAPVQPLSIRYLSKNHPELEKLSTFSTGNPSEKKIQHFTQFNQEIPFFIEELDQRLNLIWPEYFVDPYMQNTKFLYMHGDNALETLFKRIGLPKPQNVFFNYAGMFSVTKDKILQHDKDFYKQLMFFLLEDPEHGFLMERLWLSIFGFEFEHKK